MISSIFKYEAIVIGVSAGGLNALTTILPQLPKNFPLPVIIVQHRRDDLDGFLSNFLNDLSNVTVKEVEERERIRPGYVYIASPNYHLLVEENKTLSLSIDSPINYARPSIDVLFESAIHVYHERLIGIILTGANSDGCLGLKKIKEVGGLTIVQDPASAESKYMPLEAIRVTNVDHILNLQEIGEFLSKVNLNKISETWD